MCDKSSGKFPSSKVLAGVEATQSLQLSDGARGCVMDQLRSAAGSFFVRQAIDMSQL